MTPFEFRNDFTRIGGGSRKWAGEKTRQGRMRIGSKGIGFLALARYCDRLVVQSDANRIFVRTIPLEVTPTRLDVGDYLGLPLEDAHLQRRLRYKIWRKGRRGEVLEEGNQFAWTRDLNKIKILENVGPVEIQIKVTCDKLGFRAILDFEGLLRLADNADLEKLDDFATIEFFEVPDSNLPRGTTIVADKLKDFVRKELRSSRRKGFVRNVGSRSGLEQFIWYLSRCTPIAYSQPLAEQNPDIQKLLVADRLITFANLEVSHASTRATLNRPIHPFEPGAISVPPDMLVHIHIDEGGLSASGFLAGSESIIFPAEFRGIAIRVRGVAIGDPGFFGAESQLTGANKAALSQITGEINVLAGLDAADALNPGRESFYEESDHFKILRRVLVGEGEHVGGYLGRAITAVLRRREVKSALADVVGRASIRRRALDDLSGAVTHLIASGDKTAPLIRQMLKSRRTETNGLSSASDFDLSVPPRIGGLAVIPGENLAGQADINYCSQTIKLDMSRLAWSWTIVLFDRRFEVVHKRGVPDHPIAEIDMRQSRIYVNWGHPIKLQMDERGFLKTALSLVLAKEAAADDTEHMMDLVLKLLSFSVPNHG